MIKKITPPVVLVLVSLLLSSCCCNDDDCEQFNVCVKVIASDDKPIAESLTDSKWLYAFVDGRYFNSPAPDVNGEYNISFPSGGIFTFVGGIADETAFRFNNPVKGEDIQNWYAEVIDYNNIPPFYYGSVTTSKGDDHVMVQMHDIRCRSHVLVRNMHSRYGAGDYQVFIGGLRQTITFEGVVCGDTLERHLDGDFQENSDHWLSKELISLPTAPGEGVNVRIQRDDGETIISRDVDDDGNLMALHSGDDVVFVITFGEHVSIRVAPWTEVYSDLSV